MLPIRGKVSVRLLCLLFEQLEWNLHSIQWRFYFARAGYPSCCSCGHSVIVCCAAGGNISQVCPVLHCFLDAGYKRCWTFAWIFQRSQRLPVWFRDDSEKGNNRGNFGAFALRLWKMFTNMKPPRSISYNVTIGSELPDLGRITPITPCSLLTKLSSSSTRWKSGQKTFQVLREEKVVYLHTLLYVNKQGRHLVTDRRDIWGL